MTAVKLGFRDIGGAKEIVAPNISRKSLPNKGTGHVGTTENEWIRGTPIKWWGQVKKGRLPFYTDNSEMRGRLVSPKLDQD